MAHSVQVIMAVRQAYKPEVNVKVSKWFVRTAILVLGLGILVTAGMMVKNFRVRDFDKVGEPGPQHHPYGIPADNIYG